MSKRRKKGHLPPFVPLIRTTLASPAWKQLSFGARSLYVVLRSYLRVDSLNNGRVFRSYRDAKASAGRHRDEAVVVKFTEPALHRSCRFRAEIGGGGAVGSENPSIVQAVYPEIASQNDVQRSRAE